MTTMNKTLVAFALVLVATMASAAAPRGDQWTGEEVAQLSSMTLRELGATPSASALARIDPGLLGRSGPGDSSAVRARVG